MTSEHRVEDGHGDGGEDVGRGWKIDVSDDDDVGPDAVCSD